MTKRQAIEKVLELAQKGLTDPVDPESQDLNVHENEALETVRRILKNTWEYQTDLDPVWLQGDVARNGV